MACPALIAGGQPEGKLLDSSRNYWRAQTCRLPPPLVQDKGKLTVVLDVDETLVHSEIITEDKPLEAENIDSFFLYIQGVTLRVNKRPFLDEFLQQASAQFELIAFTAGSPEYANPLLDRLDPHRTIFRHRLFRQHCAVSHLGQGFIKDLGIVNRHLSRTVLVDNNANSFITHLDNGIPIASFFSDWRDTALIFLLEFLNRLKHEEDVRSQLLPIFRLDLIVNALVPQGSHTQV